MDHNLENILSVGVKREAEVVKGRKVVQIEGHAGCRTWASVFFCELIRGHIVCHRIREMVVTAWGFMILLAPWQAVVVFGRTTASPV